MAAFFAAVAEMDRGNTEALAGLKAVMDGQAGRRRVESRHPLRHPSWTAAPVPAAENGLWFGVE